MAYRDSAGSRLLRSPSGTALVTKRRATTRPDYFDWGTDVGSNDGEIHVMSTAEDRIFQSDHAPETAPSSSTSLSFAEAQRDIRGRVGPNVRKAM